MMSSIVMGLTKRKFKNNWSVEYQGSTEQIRQQKRENPNRLLKEADLVYPGQYVWVEGETVYVSDTEPKGVGAEPAAREDGKERPGNRINVTQDPVNLESVRPASLPPEAINQIAQNWLNLLKNYQQINLGNLNDAKSLLKSIQDFLANNPHAVLGHAADTLGQKIAEFEKKIASERAGNVLARYRDTLEKHLGRKILPENTELISLLTGLIENPPAEIDHSTDQLRLRLAQQLNLTVEPVIDVADLDTAALLDIAEQGQLERLRSELVPLAQTIFTKLNEAKTGINKIAIYQEVKGIIESFLAEAQGLSFPLPEEFTQAPVNIQTINGIENYSAYGYLRESYNYVLAELTELGVYSSNHEARFDAAGNERLLTSDAIEIAAESKFLMDYLAELNYLPTHRTFDNPREVVLWGPNDRITVTLDAKHVITGIQNLPVLGLPKTVTNFEQFRQYVKRKVDNRKYNEKILAKREANAENMADFWKKAGKQNLNFKNMLLGIAAFGTLLRKPQSLVSTKQPENLPLTAFLIDYGTLKATENSRTFVNPKLELQIEGPRSMKNYPLASVRFLLPQYKPERQTVIQTVSRAPAKGQFVLDENLLNKRAGKITNRFWDEGLRSVFWQQETSNGKKIAAKIHPADATGAPQTDPVLVEIRKDQDGHIQVHNAKGEKTNLRLIGSDRELITELNLI